MPHYYKGPLIWHPGDDLEPAPHWRAPYGAVGQIIDLRPLAEQAIAGGRGGDCVFVTKDPVADVDYTHIGQGDWNQVKTTTKQQKELLGGAEGDTLADNLFDLLTAQSDAAGSDGPPPLQPNRYGRLQITLGTRSHRQFNRRPGTRHRDQVIARARADLVELFGAQLGGEAASDIDRKYLAMLERKLGIPWLEIAGEFWQDRPPIKPTTTYTDDFNRADESLDAGNWTELRGDWEVLSNEAKCTPPGSGSAYSAARYDSDLSDDDHFAEADATAESSTRSVFGTMVRKDSSATETYYLAVIKTNGNQRRIFKSVGGTPTQLAANDAAPPAKPYTIKLDVAGSDLELFIDAASITTATDSAITGNLRAGLVAAPSSFTSTYDDWTADDGAGGGGGPTLTQLEKRPLGIARGLHHRSAY